MKQSNFSVPVATLLMVVAQWQMSHAGTHNTTSTIATQAQKIAYWTFDTISAGVIIDQSDHGLNIDGSKATLTGGLQGSALACGDTTFLGSIPASSGGQLNLPTFSIDACIYLDAASAAHRTIFSYQSYKTGLSEGFEFLVDEHGHLMLAIAPLTGDHWLSCESTRPLSTSTWHHVAGTYDGTEMRVYVDGVLAGTVIHSGGYEVPHDLARVGCQVSQDGIARNWFRGRIDEMAVYSGVLSSSEIAARHSALIPEEPAVAGLVAHWSFDSAVSVGYADVSGNGHHAVLSAPLAESPGVAGSAVACPGSGFTIKVPTSIGAFTMPTFTIEAWVYSNIDLVKPGSFYNYKTVFDNVSIESGLSEGFNINITDLGKPKLGMARTDGTAHWIDCEADTVLQPRVWYHLAATYDGAAMRMYVNGKLYNTVQYSGGYEIPHHSATIGCQVMTGGTIRNWFNGLIDEVALHQSVLPPDSIKSRYEKLKPAPEAPFEINFGMKTAYCEPGETLWMPIFVTNHEEYAISACQFTINLDTTFLKLIDISKDSGLVKSWPLFDWNRTASSAVTVGLGGLTTSIKYGEGELVRCKFQVKNTVSSGDSSAIRLSDIVIDETNKLVVATATNGRVIVTRPSVLHGDVTGNGEVNIFDAQKILGYIVGSITLPDKICCPNFTTAVADVSGNGMVTSYDAALVFQHSVGMLPVFPIAKSGGMPKRMTTAQTANLAVAITRQSATEGVTFSVVGSGLRGFVAGEFSIQYDPAIVNFSKGEITTSLRGAALTARLIEAERHIRIALTTNDDIDLNDQVALVDISVPPPASQTNLPSALKLSIALVNEGRIPTNIEAGSIAGGTTELIPEVNAKHHGEIQAVPGMLRIRCSNQNVPVMVRLYSLDGRQVMEWSAVSEAARSLEVSTSAMRQGVYIYKVSIGAENFVQSFVIRR